MGGIFISYRRDDSGPYAGRLRDTLTHHFGAEQVFRDIDSVDPGERFPRLIEQEVGSCDALLALIGPSGWRSPTPRAGAGWMTPMTSCAWRSRPLWPGPMFWSSPSWSTPRRCPPPPTCRSRWLPSLSATPCGSPTKTGTRRWHA